MLSFTTNTQSVVPTVAVIPGVEGSFGSSKGKGPGAELILRRHLEWREHEITWRWLQDSYEGGNRYRQAIYGLDHRGMPVRNMIRHKREYPSPRELAFTSGTFITMPITNPTLSAWSGFGVFPGQLGSDPAALATDDSYEYRRARTPVPCFVGQAVELHLSRIFSHEVRRDSGNIAELDEWWKDVDGAGTPIDDWMTETIAPLLMTLGQLDLLFDHPVAPADAKIASRADQKAFGLNRCVASYILPENMLWWQLDSARRYKAAMVREYTDTKIGGQIETYRLWEADKSTLFDMDGNVIEDRPHSFGRVPIVRIFDVRKTRCGNVGKSRYQEIAEIQREYYNRSSELVLSDSLQAHPLLQAPEDYCKSDGEVPIGPDYLLPKKKDDSGTSASYEGFEFIDPPKGAAESLRQNMADLRDAADRSAALTKPAGATGTTGKTVAQSGVSKQLDQSTGNDLLTKIASVLARAERMATEMVLLVARDKPPSDEDLDKVKVSYPSEFDLFTADDLANGTESFQAILAASGEAPKTELALLQRLVRLLLPGLEDDQYEQMDEELEETLAEKERAKDQLAEAGVAAASAGSLALPDPNTPPDPDAPGGVPDDGGGHTPPVIPGLQGKSDITGGLYENAS